MNGSPSAETHGRTELSRPLSIGFPGSPESGVLPLGIGGGLERLESMMPSRILREGIISSEAVNSLSESAENFYRRLMSIVDDYGRYFAHPALLRAACYPLKLDSVSDADVQQRLSECEAAGLVVVYGVESKSFLWIANFRQQTRSKSKFPEPVGTDLLSKCEANDKHLLAGSYKSRRDSNTNIEIRDPKYGSLGKSENLFFGEVPEDLVELSSNLPPADNAAVWHDCVQDEVAKLGYSVQREVSCSFTNEAGEAENGFIDLVATKGGLEVAIELDRRTPRKKSVRKVKTYPVGIVLLRDPKIPKPPVDARKLALPRTVEDVEGWAEMDNLPKDQAAPFFDHFEGIGWRDRNGNSVVNARAKFHTWCRNGEAREKEKGDKGFWKIKEQLKLCEQGIAAIEARAVETPLETKIQARDEKRYSELKKRRKELREQIDKL